MNSEFVYARNSKMMLGNTPFSESLATSGALEHVNEIIDEVEQTVKTISALNVEAKDQFLTRAEAAEISGNYATHNEVLSTAQQASAYSYGAAKLDLTTASGNIISFVNDKLNNEQTGVAVVLGDRITNVSGALSSRCGRLNTTINNVSANMNNLIQQKDNERKSSEESIYNYVNNTVSANFVNAIEGLHTDYHNEDNSIKTMVSGVKTDLKDSLMAAAAIIGQSSPSTIVEFKGIISAALYNALQ